ncbi:MAG: Plug domain-containing protein [Chitinispirillaceae bacterium]|nr:Plug domain-containing protein [Chitinispirillaceae bacterium]
MSPHFLLFMAVAVVLQSRIFAENQADIFSDSVVVTDTSSKGDQSPPDSSGKMYRLNRMVVTSPRIVRPRRPTAQPAKVFSSDEMASTAGVEGDICRYIATLPSTVSSLGENFDNALYVRGGRPSEVIFVVDGIELENINHFSQANGSGGPIGFINSDFVKEVDYFAGNAPVSYPSRLSSVIAINLKNGLFTQRRHSLGCKLNGGMFSTEGPFLKGNGSYVLACRYIDFSLFKRFIADLGIPRLGDAYFKGMYLGHKAGDLSITGLLSHNTFNWHYPVVETEDVSAQVHGNTIEEIQRIVQGGCGMTYQVQRETMSHRADVSVSFRDGGGNDSLHYFTDTFFVSRYAGNPVRKDSDTRFRVILTTKSDIIFGDTRFLTFGIRGNYQDYRFLTNDNRRYGLYVFCSDTGAFVVDLNKPPRKRLMHLDGLEASGYAELTSEADPFEWSIGMRADYYQLLRDVALSPRLAITLQKEGMGSLMATCGIEHQFPTEMPSLFFYFLSWFTEMSDDSATVQARSYLERLEPLRCYQAAVGYERQLASWMMLKADAYFKWYDREYHFVSPKTQEVFYVNAEQELALRPQNGQRRAFGVELTLNSPKRDGINYSIGGSIFDVKNRYSDGKWYDDWTNVRYTASFSLGIRLFHNHLISIGAQGHGGRPFCPESILVDCIGRKASMYEPGQQFYSQRLDRLFYTHLRYGFEKTFNRLSAELFVEILNLFNSQPTLEYRFNGEGFEQVKPFGILPIIGGTIEW